MSKLPKKIRIINKDYDLVERTDSIDILHEGSYGNHYPVHNRIEYVKHPVKAENVDTIIHEALHAIIDIMRIKEIDKDDEEEVVRKLTVGVKSLIQDNKKMFRSFIDML